jgi:hypothetical protein
MSTHIGRIGSVIERLGVVGMPDIEFSAPQSIFAYRCEPISTKSMLMRDSENFLPTGSTAHEHTYSKRTEHRCSSSAPVRHATRDRAADDDRLEVQAGGRLDPAGG